LKLSSLHVSKKLSTVSTKHSGCSNQRKKCTTFFFVFGLASVWFLQKLHPLVRRTTGRPAGLEFSRQNVSSVMWSVSSWNQAFGKSELGSTKLVAPVPSVTTTIGVYAHHAFMVIKKYLTFNLQRNFSKTPSAILE